MLIISFCTSYVGPKFVKLAEILFHTHIYTTLICCVLSLVSENEKSIFFYVSWLKFVLSELRNNANKEEVEGMSIHSENDETFYLIFGSHINLHI